MLFHRDLGGAGRPPLVILHGLLGSSRNWQAAGRDLAAAFHVHAVDLRNHGASPHDASNTYADLAADVVEFLRLRVGEPAWLLGHSLGGKAALRVAARHPELLRGLVVVDIAPRRYDGGAHRGQIRALEELDLATLRTREEADGRLASAVQDWAHRKFLLTNLERTETGWRWAANLPVLLAHLDALLESPLGPGDAYLGPALVVRGSASDYIRDSDLPAVRAALPQAEVVALDSGHNPHFDRKDAFVAAVTTFASRVTSGNVSASPHP